MNESGKNHDSLRSTHDGHDDETKLQCYETRREYISVECEELELVLFIEI